MWVFSRSGFFSIVRCRNRPGFLHVRARFAGDLEGMFPGATVEHTPEADYAYRVSLPVDRVVSVLSRQLESIDYENFKNAADPSRQPHLHEVWSVMYGAQEEAAFWASQQKPPL